MIMRGLELRCVREPFYGDEIAFLLVERNENGTHSIGRNVTMEVAEPGRILTPEPTFRLPSDAAQRLMDELWAAGLRPTQGRQSEGAMSAQERHLGDMRALAFAKLGVDKP